MSRGSRIILWRRDRETPIHRTPISYKSQVAQNYDHQEGRQRPVVSQEKEKEMKLEIEITEAEIKSAIERKVRTAVADESNAWRVDDYIRQQVKAHWQAAVDSLIQEQLSNSARLKEKIQTAIENKLRGQITALMKEKK
jgi:hypothetical protein